MTELRWRFVFGDLFSNLLVGVVTGALCHCLFGSDWSMLSAMLAGMALGMLVAEILSIGGLMWLFGDTEIMLSTMTTGMLAGMAVSMSRAMASMPGQTMNNTLFDHLLVSALLGLAVIAAIWLLNFILSGARKVATDTGNDASNGQ